MNMRMIRAGTAIAAATLVLASSAVAGPKKSADPTASRDTLTQVGRSFEFQRDPEIMDVVNDIGGQVARAYRAPRTKYHFYVINDPNFNAFSTPSGDIFLFSGQLTKLRCEDELAAVLAHEIGHKEADHFGEIARKSTLMTIPAVAAMILSKGDEKVVTSAIAVASAFQLQFSREMESEADLMGMHALQKTAFDPMAMAGALEVIERNDQLMPMDYPEHLLTHPPMEIRRASLESVLGKSLKDVHWAPRPSQRWTRVRAIAAGLAADPDAILKAWRALPADAQTPEARHLNGLSLLKAGHAREALEEFNKASEAMPDDPMLQADIGAAHYELGEPDAAKPHLEAARKALPAYAYPYFYLAEMEREKGRVQPAAILYQKAMDARPEIPEAFYQYGLILGARGEREGESAYCLGAAALLSGNFRDGQTLLHQAKEKLKGPYWQERIDERLSIFQ
jgi:predicted Zn-dependent protease